MGKADLGNPKGLLGIAAIALAFIFAFASFPQGAMILFFLGLIIGFVNVVAEERQKFLIATVALTLVAGILKLNVVTGIDLGFVGFLLTNILAIAAPAAFIVGVREFWEYIKG